ncbi:MAG: DUF1816 domain-containing protein [Mastigocoleus sp. MO_167.B18]|uniref:DUF1816 domain-containing protein n=1 Tax=Mastigocoleus sp. MO_188.B34 TaxID=3036635 RepID=UPI00262977C3|nr:DUF1816 domain-containing protein [Mastigocoleus sp. MO_188.B34]MDJ0696897.1 DUF1816 domain-containing protein [Mastigocoleus sp. MO_188.B34]MDJ0774765.1 DUF1816 domain-containing protein [Mastigocoleus sp. MO_167.B18]
MNVPFLSNISLLKKLPFLSRSNTPYWIKITTNIPKCTYYFGPFESSKEAEVYEDGYIEDLVQEKALGISVETKQFQPEYLTICEDE